MRTWATGNGEKITQILSGRSNVFLLTNGKKNILIDTSPTQKQKLLFKSLDSLNLNKIDFLILTHTHYDHASNSKKIKNVFGARVIVHSSEADILLKGKSVIPAGTNFFTRNIISPIGKKINRIFDFEPCIADIAIEDKFDLASFSFNTYLLPTPGHSPGCISIVVNNEIAIVEDALFGIFKESIFPPFADDVESLIESWGKLLETGCHLFLPAHGSARKAKTIRKEYLKRQSNSV